MRVLSVLLSTNQPHKSRWQGGGICPLLSTGVFTLFCHVFMASKKMFSPPMSLVLLTCSRVCPLDVSRLLGLTLRSSAPVCCCHRDPLSGGKLTTVQEAVRVFFSVFSFCSARDGMFPVISGSRREMSLQALLKFKRPATT